MKKHTSIIVFCITVIVAIATVLVAVFGFGGKHIGSARNITLGLDLRGGASVTYQVQNETFTPEEMADTIYKLQLRVAEYSSDATVYQEGANRITVEIPGVYDTQTVIEDLGRPGTLYFIREHDSEGNDNYTYNANIGEYELTKLIDQIIADGYVVMSGSDVTQAEAGYQSDNYGSQEVVVRLQLNEAGTAAFAEATTQAKANGETIGIYYDGHFVSVPRVESAITNGQAIITGEESYESAQRLASTIRIGSLSLQLEEITSKVVSAKLGDNAISTSLIAGLIGLILIVIFMILLYRIPGLAAAIAMVFYAGAMLVLLNAFNLTLTVSGIAGIILSIGMAVDGNVIINARIKEELATGLPVDQAIKNGFKKSTSAILDGNITTLIVAIVLLIFGSGSVQGFGMTLAIGIVLSVFTSLVVSRLLVTSLYGMGAKSQKMYATIKKTGRKVFDFVGKKVIWFVIAIVCMVAGAAAMIINGVTGRNAMNFSIEFVGGVSTTVDFQKEISIDEFNNTIRKDIQDLIGSTDVEGQKVTGTTQYVIKTPQLEQETITELKNLFVDSYGADESSFEITRITAVVSKELQQDALISLAIAAALMLIYIWIRFRRFKVAISSVIALLHDVVIVLAFYAIFRVSVGNSFIACILTIVGYSINATIVIFDRMRENLSNPALNYDQKLVINTSIQQSLSRSLFTSATTFVTVLFLYILGIESMKAFALPLGVGIIAGAFSSIFISGNLVYLFTKKSERYDEKAAKAAARFNAVPAAETVAQVTEEVKDTVQDRPKITANPNHKKKKKRKQ